MMDNKKRLDSVPHNLVEKCLEMFQSVDYSIHRFPVTVHTGLENCPVRWYFELRKAKWADVRTACLKDKLKFCFFFKAYRLTIKMSCFFLLTFEK